MGPPNNPTPAQRWQPVDGHFSRSFLSDFGPAVPKAPVDSDDLRAFSVAAERIIANISGRHTRNGSASAEEITHVRSICVAEGAPDYSKHSGAFFNLFFAKNMLKAASVVGAERQLCTAESVRILDLGAGSGASALGVASALLQRKVPPKHIFLDLVERSPEQSSLAQEIFNTWKAETHAPISFQIIQADVLETVRSISKKLYAGEFKERYDLIMSSYLITELNGSIASDLAVELQLFSMNTIVPCPALLFMGSYAPGNHFGYYLHNPARGDPDFGAIDVILKAIGLREILG